MCGCCVQRQVPECKAGNNDGGGSFEDEQVAPWSKSTTFDLEDTKGEKTGECTGDGLGGVEDCEAAGEFASAVEPLHIVSNLSTIQCRGPNLHRLVVDDKREKR